jgi:hypothetical protein
MPELTATGTPITPNSPRDPKGNVLEPRPSTPVPDITTHRPGLKPYILVDRSGTIVGHADDAKTATEQADDLALGLAPNQVLPEAGAVDKQTPDLAAKQEPKYEGHGVTVYLKLSHHLPRVFSPGELREATAEGPTLVSVKQKRAKLVVESSKKEIAEALAVATDKAPKAGKRNVGASKADKDAREAELNALSADEVKAIAKAEGIETSTKAENIAAILKVEF